MQNRTQQRVVNLDVSVVADQSKLAEFVHESTNAGPGGADHLRQCFLTDVETDRIDKVPAGDRWIHEIKFDGYRVQLHIATDGVRVFTRRGNDWTKRLKKIADDAFLISAGSAIIDGEVVVPAPDGTTDFSVLQNELRGHSRKIVMVAFDPSLSQRVRPEEATAC